MIADQRFSPPSDKTKTPGAGRPRASAIEVVERTGNAPAWPCLQSKCITCLPPPHGGPTAEAGSAVKLFDASAVVEPFLAGAGGRDEAGLAKVAVEDFHRLMRSRSLLSALPVAVGLLVCSRDVQGAETAPPWPGDAWRREHRVIDLHQHIDGTAERTSRAVRIMDRSGIGIGANLSGGVVTAKPGGGALAGLVPVRKLARLLKPSPLSSADAPEVPFVPNQ